MPKGLCRFHASGQRHFITCSCYHRQPFLGSARRRDLFLTILEQVREQFDFIVWGYVVMGHPPRSAENSRMFAEITA
jgi:REP element-mobilizing transposase RayT